PEGRRGRRASAKSASPDTAPARASSARAKGEPSAPAEQRARAAGAAERPTDHALADRVLEAVRADPGKTVAEYAEILGLPATGLYRPVRELTTEGVLANRARQLYPT